MSFWSHNPELLDEITTENLPEPWKTQVIEGEMLTSDVPDEILFPAMDEGIQEYWANRIDEARMRMKEKMLEERKEFNDC